MESENIKYLNEFKLIKELLMNAEEARRFYLKYDIIDKIISLFTSDKEQSDENKWEKLLLLQKRINTVKYELGEDEAYILLREAIDQLSDYLFRNKDFKEEASENVILLSNIQNMKVNTFEKTFNIEWD